MIDWVGLFLKIGGVICVAVTVSELLHWWLGRESSTDRSSDEYPEVPGNAPDATDVQVDESRYEFSPENEHTGGRIRGGADSSPVVVNPDAPDDTVGDDEDARFHWSGHGYSDEPLSDESDANDVYVLGSAAEPTLLDDSRSGGSGGDRSVEFGGLGQVAASSPDGPTGDAETTGIVTGAVSRGSGETADPAIDGATDSRVVQTGRGSSGDADATFNIAGAVGRGAVDSVSAVGSGGEIGRAFRRYLSEVVGEEGPDSAKLSSDQLKQELGDERARSTEYEAMLRARRELASGVPPRRESVEFAAFAPGVVVPGSSFHLDVWAYLEEQYDSVVSRVMKANAKAAELGSKAGVPVPIGEVVTVSLEIDSFEIEYPVDTIIWNSSPASASFLVSVPVDAEYRSYPGRVTLAVNGLMIAELRILVNVSDERAVQNSKLSMQAFYPKSAFASYSSRDRERVLIMVAGMKQVRPDMDVFLDIVTLRSGDLWADALEYHVPNKDVFYLFWSRHAANSEWVEREWRRALKLRGIEYIKPAPLENSQIAPPPKDLSQLHFSSEWVAHFNEARKFSETE